jgi:hypothetical protein
MEPEGVIRDDCPGNTWELFQTILLALSVAGLSYYCYYLLAPWIWSQNIPFEAADITPWIRPWTEEHDGIEIYALYVLVFVNIFGALILSWVVGYFPGKWVQRIVTALFLAVSCVYCVTIGFTPP